jgi:hypothetical protein
VNEQEWRRRMGAMALLLLPVGLLLMALGAVFSSSMLGYTIGAVGVTAFVLGALFGKFSLMGPVPDGVRGAR